MAHDEPLTPAMRQWRQVKDEHPDKIVLFRMGDFYEMFGQDAREASALLEIALTTRDKNKADPMPMCGIPYHALDLYLGRLIRSGRKAVLCDQMESPSAAKGLIHRQVTRVVTPGTVLEDGVVAAEEPVILAAWNPGPSSTGLVWADLSSGDLAVWISSREEALERLNALAPAEVLYPGGAVAPEGQFALSPMPDKAFAPPDLMDALARRFGLPAGLPGLPPASEPLGALHALLEYVRSRGGQTLRRPRLEVPGTFVAMDEATRRNLELVQNGETGERKGSLLGCLDSTQTPMGARLLRDWVLAPAADLAEITVRQDTVGAWVDHPEGLTRFRALLKGFPDLGRLVARFGAKIASPRDAGALRGALGAFPALLDLCRSQGEVVPGLTGAFPQAEDWFHRLDLELEEALPPHAREGGIFARGFHSELDEFRNLAENAREAILEVERRERERTGIGSLKIRYNKNFGYFLEISRAQLAKAPEDYERRQTLVGAERFVTQELRDLEHRILSAQSQRETLEAQLWGALVENIQEFLPALRDASADLARMDVLAGFAAQARIRGYARPLVVGEPTMDVEEGRHPVLELDDRHRPFVPNPVHVDTAGRQILLVTGPNMGGKSTYLRQVALLCVMAHMGAWVPARSATVGLVDRLFCRVGASDSLMRGLSTFMVEMTETAAILHGATCRSLVILDEVGRGTSTYDGMAIAWAVVEAILGPEGIGCRTLFATHYHELTELGRTLPGVKNLTMAVREHGGKVHFLRSVEDGAADKSYGIHVAELAGIPAGVVDRARDLLNELETRREGLAHPPASGQPRQVPLFGTPLEGAEEEVVALLRAAHPEKMTPLQALLLVERLKKKLT
jgi:DNA mismatch repair protein MutS